MMKIYISNGWWNIFVFYQPVPKIKGKNLLPVFLFALYILKKYMLVLLVFMSLLTNWRKLKRQNQKCLENYIIKLSSYCIILICTRFLKLSTIGSWTRWNIVCVGGWEWNRKSVLFLVGCLVTSLSTTHQ